MQLQFEIKYKKFLINFEFPFSNLVGFGSDGANVMRGKNHSVLKFLREKTPQLFDLHCLAHSSSLADKNLSEYFPTEITFI